MTPSIDPIAPWPLIAVAALAIVVLTLWAYRKKLRGTTGRWRWVALGLRLLAVVLCILAALRPSMLVLQKQQQMATVLFLVDTSSSMGLGGEAGNQTRLEAARRALEEGVKAVKDLGEDTVPTVLAFDAEAREVKPDEALEAKGRVTALGAAMEEAVRRNESTRILRLIDLTDGGSNIGVDPRAIAQSLGSRQIKVDAVGFGSESAGAGTKDVAIRDLEAGGPVFAKTELEVKARIDVRGYPDEDLELELYAEGKADPVAKVKVRVPPNYTEIVPRGLKWTPEDPGETRLTLKVKPKKDELIPTNNETRTFVTVLKGGIGVFYIAGISSPWERKYLAESLDASEKIQLDWRALTQPGDPQVTEALQSRRYDVYILGDLPAEFLTAEQRRLLVEAVRNRGAGLIMLGGRSSFGSGGWAGTDVADVLPVELHPGDGQIEPEGGLKVLPNPRITNSYVMRIAPTMPEAIKLWGELPRIGGANRFAVKQAAEAWALSEAGEPLIAGIETGRGRSMAFAGETWPWYRAGILSPEFQLAHLNFWRNTILWLAHKEDEGDTQVLLKLDQRRVAVGQRLSLEATARDAKGEPIPGVEFQATVTRTDAPDAKPEPLEKFLGAGDTRRGAYLATGETGEYKVEVKATRGGEAVGTATARFLVFDDDRELRNPAADLSLLRSIATESGGAYLPPEKLADHIRSLKSEVVPDYVTQSEVKLWDNWPFLLLFTMVLTLEWWLRKRHGWV
jgi:uncharacterized membrane protein